MRKMRNTRSNCSLVQSKTRLVTLFSCSTTCVTFCFVWVLASFQKTGIDLFNYKYVFNGFAVRLFFAIEAYVTGEICTAVKRAFKCKVSYDIYVG